MTENNITKDLTLNRVIKLYPKSLEVLNKFHLDSCCGGAKTLEESAKAANADIDTLLVELNKKTGNP
jgi:regulator of cell morphogenesis and NO signaling